MFDNKANIFPQNNFTKRFFHGQILKNKTLLSPLSSF